MAASISGIRRNIKNVAHNYTDAQVKVRAATSNDPWGPSSTQMSEIADLTYNVIAFSEIMQMIWKRVNDSGKNWRHVYKALVLLEYLIKTGSEKVAAQCKENLFSIQTLKDFQFIEENKDQGLNVREKAKTLVALLKDDERLKNERVRALKAKERFSHSTAGIGSDTAFMGGSDILHAPSEIRDEHARPEIELARPQTSGEEELQLQLALAMSREEAETDENKQKSDDMRLQLALQKSKEENERIAREAKKNALDDLVDLNFGNPAPPQRTSASLDPWGGGGSGGGGNDPWGGASTIPDPWGGIGVPDTRNFGAGGAAAGFNTSPSRAPQAAATQDPWGAPQQNNQGAIAAADPWGAPAPASVSPKPWGAAAPASPQPWGASGLSNHASPNKQDPFSPQGATSSADLLAGFSASLSPSRTTNGGGGAVEQGPWDLSALDPVSGSAGVDLLADHGLANTGARPKNTVESLLGEHSDLVNLDSLVKAKPASTARNPFAEQPNPFQAAEQPNPFQAAAAPKPTINQLRTSTQPQTNGGSSGGWPESGQSEVNPFF